MPENLETSPKIRPPSMIAALIPIITLVIFLASAVYLYGTDATGGPIQVALILAGIVAMLVGVKNGHSLDRLWVNPQSMASPRPSELYSSCWLSAP